LDTPERLLSVILPCQKEADNIHFILSELNKYAKSARIKETIVVDDASEDGTAKVAESFVTEFPELNVKVVTRPKPRKGYGAVVRFGMNYATGKYCTFVGADGVDPLQLLPTYVENLDQGADLVQCRRYFTPEDSGKLPRNYRIYQTLFQSFQRVALGRRLEDSTYAFKAFDMKLVQRLGITSNGFSISPEIIFKMVLSGRKIVVIPARQGFRKRGVSKFNFRKEGYGFFKVALRAGLHRLGIRWFEEIPRD